LIFKGRWLQDRTARDIVSAACLAQTGRNRQSERLIWARQGAAAEWRCHPL